MVTRLLWWVAGGNGPFSFAENYPLASITAAVEAVAKTDELSSATREVIEALVRRLRRESENKECRRAVDRLQTLLAGEPTIHIEPGEAWSDAAVADLKKIKAKLYQDWPAPWPAWRSALTARFRGRGRGSSRWGTLA
jgi:hypothetical protein